MSFVDKLAKIEALIQRASSEGERQAAKLAKDRILTKIYTDESNQPISYKISLASPWEKRLFVALCNKHGFQTYRYERQKYTTARLNISRNMMEEMLWPEYLKYSTMLQELVEDIMKELINSIYHVQEEEVVISGEIGVREA